MSTATLLAPLTIHADGVNGVDLGIIRDCQYALSFVSTTSKTASDVWRRKASEVGTYGGWRWECSSKLPSQYPSLPGMAELAARIDFAIAAR